MMDPNGLRFYLISINIFINVKQYEIVIYHKIRWNPKEANPVLIFFSKGGEYPVEMYGRIAAFEEITNIIQLFDKMQQYKQYSYLLISNPSLVFHIFSW